MRIGLEQVSARTLDSGPKSCYLRKLCLLGIKLSIPQVEKPCLFSPSRPIATTYYTPTKYIIVWPKSRKYNTGQKQKRHAEANAEHIVGPHDLWRPSAAPHHMVAAATMWWFIMWPATVSSICLRICFLFCPILYFPLLSHIVFSVVHFIGFPVNTKTDNPKLARLSFKEVVHSQLSSRYFGAPGSNLAVLW